MRSLATYFDEGIELALTLANSVSNARQGAPVIPKEPPASPDDPNVAHLCSRLRAALDAPGLAEASDILNGLLRNAAAAPALSADANGRWGLHLHSTNADAVAKMTVKAAASLAALIDDDTWTSLKRCSADRCDDYYLDQSRNQSRRYCSVACANRVNAQRHRKRQSAATTTTTRHDTQ
ncbi:CGNR zinc finger domain-containing protein [Microbacterium sp. YY-01]|uniref:CGNR zinc finger domain-containing protein n=1 Tax=Microbacterium sp. YY-01 TaxID=3421634 RepID=UPI003D185D7F